MARRKKVSRPAVLSKNYDAFAGGIRELLESARHVSARATNAIMTATYWEIGRRIVEFEQRGSPKAAYGEGLLKRLGSDLTDRLGRGFGWRSLFRMREFYLNHKGILSTALTISPPEEMRTRPEHGSRRRSRKLSAALAISGEAPRDGRTQAGAVCQPLSVESAPAVIARHFPLPWSHYVRLLSVKDEQGREFYEAEALRGGWTVRQLDRQINAMFYERTALSRNKAAMLKKGAKAKPEDAVTPEEEIKDPFVLEFLGLKDEYSESDAEEAMIRHLESFLLELGGDFAFVGRQRRLRIGDEWYRIDLLFFHRRLRCLVVIDLKLGKFTHADAGQMHMYLNYAREHWTHADENPPVGLILCAQKDAAIAKYALEGLPNKVLAAEYRMILPDEEDLEAELTRTRKLLESRRRV